MINYYQPFLLPFLRAKKYSLPKDIKRYYYHSFEDGLWELLTHKKVPQGSLIFIPDFYCMDVIENIQAHGYNVMLYRVDKHFQIDKKVFTSLIKKLKPRVIFLFHAAGITFEMSKDIEKIAPKEILLIEDCVHRLVNPEELKITSYRHFVMDSLRKDSPLPGSFLYGTKRGVNFPAPTYKFTFDTLITNFLFIIFRRVLIVGHLVKSGMLVEIAHIRILKLHDDIIGNSKRGSAGSSWVPFIHKHFNFKKIETVKEKQVSLYQKLLASEVKKSKGKLYTIRIPESDYKNLHVFPLGIGPQVSEEFIHYLHSKNIIVWAKFADCPWSQRQKVLFLPLGFHIRDQDIRFMAENIGKYVNEPKSLLPSFAPTR